jgi:cyanophycinase-like exopeptidase
MSAVLDHPTLVGVGIDEATAVVAREGMTITIK